MGSPLLTRLVNLYGVPSKIKEMRAAQTDKLFTHVFPWICRSCLRRKGVSIPGTAKFTTKAIKGYGKKKRRTPIVLASTAGTLGAGTLFFADDLKHGYAAAKRTGRVVSTLAVCMNEFVNLVLPIEVKLINV